MRRTFFMVAAAMLSALPPGLAAAEHGDPGLGAARPSDATGGLVAPCPRRAGVPRSGSRQAAVIGRERRSPDVELDGAHELAVPIDLVPEVAFDQ